MRLVTRLRPLLVAAAVLAAACDRPAEYGVSVFSTDTLPATFTVTLTGSLGLALRSDGFAVRPDKSLLMTTPAQMYVARGDGTARIESVRGAGLAVKAIGVDSSADTTTVEGHVVMLTVPPLKRQIQLKSEKP